MIVDHELHLSLCVGIITAERVTYRTGSEYESFCMPATVITRSKEELELKAANGSCWDKQAKPEEIRLALPYVKDRIKLHNDFKTQVFAEPSFFNILCCARAFIFFSFLKLAIVVVFKIT